MANNSSAKEKKKKTPVSSNFATQKLWDSIAKNYDMIKWGTVSNSFIILMALNDSNEPLNTTQISEIIALKYRGQIYKISATLKDSLEHRLKREGYVKGVNCK